MRAKIGDVAGCVNLYRAEDHQELQITPLFSSPQQIERALTNNGSSASLSDDIYSFGTVLFEAFTRYDAYQDLDMRQIMHAVSSGERSLHSEYPDEVIHVAEVEDDRLVKALMMIINGCTEFEPQARPLAGDLIKAFSALESIIQARETVKGLPNLGFQPGDAKLLSSLLKRRSTTTADNRRGTTAIRINSIDDGP